MFVLQDPVSLCLSLVSSVWPLFLLKGAALAPVVALYMAQFWVILPNPHDFTHRAVLIAS